MFWGSAGPKNAHKRASCDGRINAEKYVETLQDNFFQGTEATFGKKVSHSSSNMSLADKTRANQATMKLIGVIRHLLASEVL